MNHTKDIKEKLQGKTVGEIVAADYRTAHVFRKYNIDFCCNGARLLEDACSQERCEVGIVQKEIEEVLVSLSGKDESINDFKSWRVDELADYIVRRHHHFCVAQIPILKAYLKKISEVHGDKHTELLEINALFNETSGELMMHMKKEEMILFPYIRKMAKALETGNESPHAAFGTVQSPIRNMMHEHDVEGQRFRRINQLSKGYAVPAEGCNTYTVAFTLLQAFEEDLHLHIHLENNILFPAAIELEQQLLLNSASS